MRTLAFAAVALFALPVASACGGSDPSDLFGNPFGDAGPGSGDGSSADAAACDLSKCAINVPAGFRLLTYATDRSKDCQAGWKTTDVLSDPVADPATCSCACNVTTPPDCSKGTIHRFNGFSTCTTAATSVVATGLCDPIAGGITLAAPDYSANAPPATGGACTFQAKADPTKVTGSPRRLCEVPASCPGAACGASNLCVAQDGDVACPGDYSVKKLVGATPDADCAACPSACTATADCKGTLSLFTDNGCTMGQQDFPVDGTCNSVVEDGALYVALKYAGSVKGSPGCGPTPPSPVATPKLDKPTTICCKKA